MLAPRPLGVPSSCAFALLIVGCAAGADRTGFGKDEPATEPAEAGASNDGRGDFGPKDDSPADAGADPEVNEVYGQSETALYKLEPATKAVTVVGDFKGCEPVVDIALDERSTLYAASYKTLYTVDKKTAECTVVSKGKYPNSLSFVPKGTLDPEAEALVGYEGDDYIRIDVQTGQTTPIGKLGNNLVSSGDIVSVKGGATYLTVKGGACSQSDCLVEVDPATGKMIKNWGDIEHKQVFGLSFWGGSLFGFDNDGNLFEVTFGSKKIVTTTIPIPKKPSGLSFWGAGSSTSAPLVSRPQ